MVLAWRDLTPGEREAYMMKADTAESATAALAEHHAEPGVATSSLKQAFEAAKEAFPTALAALTDDERLVAQKRLVAHDAPTLEAVAATLGYTRAGAQKIEARAAWKLRRWLVELLDQHRG
jgi:DNA-directed RNA polymerase sigma subunit (sigma70/sigma32)